MSDQAIFDTLLSRIRGHQLAALIHLAVRWDLADRIGNGRHLDDLAHELLADAGPLRRALCALAAFDIFTVGYDGLVEQTAASRLLMRSSSPSLHAAARFWAMPAAWAAWGELEDAVRTGECAFERTFHQSLFDYLEENAEDRSSFQQFMSASPDDRHRAVARAYDFARFEQIVDIGGGNGMQLAMILAACPASRGILCDRESVVEHATREIVELARAERCEIVACDFFDHVPRGADAYVLSQIVHDWDDTSALKILRKCREAARSDSVLLVIERFFESNGGTTHPNSFLSDIEMLVLHGAAERSANEYRTLINKSGFRIERVVQTDSPFSVIECVPIQA
ncbi:hypothetical protein LJR230_002166 [Trinickia sp. LjRoot230]|uniref:methyltransferase n=1 Tax=Trinickia sp. LjRoot230 TaxID=3342288 RepID=UPI003ECD7533